MGLFLGSRFNKSPLVYLLIMALQFLQHTCFAGAGEIVLHPRSTHVPLGGLASFNCLVIGESTRWVINNKTVSDESTYVAMEFRFSETVIQSDTDNRRHQHNLTLEFEATPGRNETEVRCVAFEDRPAFSDLATLTIMGKSSAPVPRLRPIHATRLMLEWDIPFTWDSFPIDHYDVIVPGHPEWTEMGYRETSIDFVIEPSSLEECEEIRFEVKANNGLEDSEAGVISGGFPKAPTLIDDPINEVVSFSSTLVPSVRFDIQLPHVCDYQYVTYTVALRQENTKEIVVDSEPIMHRYGDGESVQFVVDVDLKADIRYTAIVTFTTHAEQSPEISRPLTVHKSFYTSVVKSTLSSPRGINDETGGPLSTQMIIIISIVGTAFLIITVLIVAIIFMAVVRRRRTAVVENVDCGTPDHKRSGSLKRPPMVTNPIYEGPVYESIDPQLNRLNSSAPSTPTALLLPSPYANTTVDPTYIFPSLPNEDSYTIMNAAGRVGKTVDDDDEPNNESNLDRDPAVMRYAPDPSGGTTVISEC